MVVAAKNAKNCWFLILIDKNNYIYGYEKFDSADDAEKRGELYMAFQETEGGELGQFYVMQESVITEQSLDFQIERNRRLRDFAKDNQELKQSLDHLINVKSKKHH